MITARRGLPVTAFLAASLLTVAATPALTTEAAGRTADDHRQPGRADRPAGTAHTASSPVSGPIGAVSLLARLHADAPAPLASDAAASDAAAPGALASDAVTPDVVAPDAVERAAAHGRPLGGAAQEPEAAAEVQEPAEPAEPDPAGPDAAEPEPAAYVAADGERIDAERIRPWLEGRGSPLADHAETLIEAGVAHEVDPRLVIGIAAIESSVGTRLPASTHNAWGWSGTGPHGLHAWGSWPEAIEDFTARLARIYDVDRVDEEMARTYCPPNWRAWLDTVRWVIDDL